MGLKMGLKWASNWPQMCPKLDHSIDALPCLKGQNNLCILALTVAEEMLVFVCLSGPSLTTALTSSVWGQCQPFLKSLIIWMSLGPISPKMASKS